MSEAAPRRSSVMRTPTNDSDDLSGSPRPDFSASGVSDREFKIARTRLRKILGVTLRAQKVVKATAARRYHRLGLAGRGSDCILTATSFEPPATSPRTAVLDEMDHDEKWTRAVMICAADMFEDRHLGVFFGLKNHENESMLIPHYIAARRQTLKKETMKGDKKLSDNADSSIVDIDLLRELGDPLGLGADQTDTLDPQKVGVIRKPVAFSVLMPEKPPLYEVWDRTPVSHKERCERRKLFLEDIAEFKEDRKRMEDDDREKLQRDIVKKIQRNAFKVKEQAKEERQKAVEHHFFAVLLQEAAQTNVKRMKAEAETKREAKLQAHLNKQAVATERRKQHQRDHWPAGHFAPPKIKSSEDSLKVRMDKRQQEIEEVERKQWTIQYKYDKAAERRQAKVDSHPQHRKNDVLKAKLVTHNR